MRILACLAVGVSRLALLAPRRRSF